MAITSVEARDAAQKNEEWSVFASRFDLVAAPSQRDRGRTSALIPTSGPRSPSRAASPRRRSTRDRRRIVGQVVGTVFVIVTVLAVMAPAASAARMSKGGPSKKAKMVCTTHTQRELNGVLAAKAQVSTPTWTDHVYSCTYRYSSGSFAMSVKVLANNAAAAASFDDQRAALGPSAPTPSLGDEAFQEPNGLLVVRKDNDVLRIDPTGLPPVVGKQHTPPRDVAFTAAVVILGCWH